jgi:undecaprenyl-phosphate 4-deoxy-4-formamido-L-arabinose transferase
VNLSVVVPVYNSERTLSLLVEKLERTLSTISARFEVILVNDGSRDGSWRVIEQLAEAFSWVRGINLMRNYGQHNALLCGIRAAQFEVIVTLDDDLQHPPEEIPKLLRELDRGYDAVYGTPQKSQHELWRGWASQLTRLMLRMAMRIEIAGDVSAFRAFRTRLRESFADYGSPFVFIDVLLTWGASRFVAIPVRHDPRRAGVSNYTFRTLITQALTMLTSFSTVPLRFASFMGFGFTLFGLVVLAYVIGRFVIQGGSVPGFPFLASIIAIFSGAQLFALGIIGEYLGRVHLRGMNRPSYVIHVLTGSEKKAGQISRSELVPLATAHGSS